MDPQTEATIKLLLCIGALVVLARRHLLLPGKIDADRAGTLLMVAAVVAGFAYTNFGLFQRWPPLHTRELFHYFLGSKYYAELEHDGLYVASMTAQFESHPELEVQALMRDLETHEILPIQSFEHRHEEVRARFDDDRWAQFVADHDYFVTPEGVQELGVYRLDHGYNPSPTWTFVARLFSTHLQASDATFLFLASLDLLLMGAMCFAIFKTYGGRVAAMVVLLLGLGAPWRYGWIGGAFLRADWLAAVGLGICALKRERFVLAGGLIGYAAMVRIFPIAFLVGPTVVALRQWRAGERPLWLLRLAAGALTAATVGFGVGTLTGNGPGVWRVFFENISVYRENRPTNGIGLEDALLADRAASIRAETNNAVEGGKTLWTMRMDELARERRPLILAALVLLVVLALVSMWSRPPPEAAVLGAVLLFAGLSMACYYWIMLALVPLAGALWLPTAGVLGVNVLMYDMLTGTPTREKVYGACSFALFVFWLLWLVPWAMKTLRPFVAAARARKA